MTARPFSFAVLLLIFSIISVFVFFSDKIETDKVQQKSNYIVRGMPPNPPLVKAQGYPPTTEQAKAQWEWWRRMMKQDRGFQWKMPISFYGRVLDQFDDPVSDAKVKLEWSADGSVPKRTLYTDSNGLFSIEGIHGKGISISVFKKGYNQLRDGESRSSFEYADFSQSHFHVPNKNEPYIFRLQKLVSPEPQYRRTTKFKMKPNQVMTIDAMRGKVEKLPVTLIIDRKISSSDEKKADYKFIISMNEGAGLIETKLDYVVGTLAPESGYQTEYVHEISMRDLHGFSVKIMFFIKTPSGKYARMGTSFMVGRDESNVAVTVVYNPSGSRNLESDESLIIN